MHDITQCLDVLEVYRRDKNTREWKLERKTVKNPSIFQQFLRKVGILKCADDAFTNWMINQVAQFTGTTLLYAGVGTSATSGTDYTLNDLVTPVMTRVTPTISYLNVYGLDATYPDTVQYVVIMTATSSYTLREAALFTAATGGYMGARQVMSDMAITAGEEIALVWRITYGRG